MACLRLQSTTGCGGSNRKRWLQVIDNFAVYNGEGFMSTLELLPMWQNVDPDVDLFGSGVISELDEHDSEWGTGHPLSANGPSTCPRSLPRTTRPCAPAPAPVALQCALWHVLLRWLCCP
jgi:hypothetical protein